MTTQLQKLFDGVISFLYALFFTRDDDLDVLQLLFTSIIIIALLIVWNLTTIAGNSDAVKIESLVTLRWLIGLLVITAVPKWIVPFMAKVKDDTELTNLLGSSKQEPIEPSEG